MMDLSKTAGSANLSSELPEELARAEAARRKLARSARLSSKIPIFVDTISWEDCLCLIQFNISHYKITLRTAEASAIVTCFDKPRQGLGSSLLYRACMKTTTSPNMLLIELNFRTNLSKY